MEHGRHFLELLIKWVKEPESISNWVIDGRTVLLLKPEDLSNEKDHRPDNLLRYVLQDL